MRNFVTFISCAAVTFCLFVSTANADTLTTANDGLWGGGAKSASFENISDGKRWGEDALYTWVNKVYSVEAINAVYGLNGFSSSDQMFDAIGISFNETVWTAGADAYAQVYYRQADLSHEVFVVNEDARTSVGSFSKADNSKVYDAREIGNVMSIAEGQFNLEVQVTGSGYNETFSTVASSNRDGFAHILGFDVTALMNYGKSEEDWVSSAYLFGFEDLYAKHFGVDWDYNDMIMVVYDLAPGAVNTSDVDSTPEPATLALFGLGFVAMPVVRRFRKK